MRLRNNPNAIQILQESEYLIKDKSKKYFNNEHPIQIEIGMGKGDFIVGMAQKYPDINFVGVEKYATVLEKALKKVEALGLNNVLLMNIDAVELLEYFDKHSIDCIYINFSDPWPKSRHEKRRLTYKTFLDLYRELLVKGGSVKQKTDNRGLFESSIESFKEYGCNMTMVTSDLHNSIFGFDNVMTEYEKKFAIEKEQPIYSAWVNFNDLDEKENKDE